MLAWYVLVVVSELTLQLFEEVVASRNPSSVPHPIRDELLPHLRQARTLEEAELAIHDTARIMAWLGDALIADPDGERLVHKALERAVPHMLTMQDDLERLVDAATGAVAARKTIVAHETLRRLFAIVAQAGEHRPVAVTHTELPSAAMPTVKYMSDVVLRLALLVGAIEYLASQRSPLVVELAHKAFETSQTFRGAMRAVGIELTPWADAPPATRTKRILEAAKSFWSSLNTDQRRAVDEAWDERVELLPRWPLPSS